MPTIIDGSAGVSKVQDGVVGTTAIAPGAVTPDKTQVGALPSMVRLNTANGYGSTNTKIRRFTNVVTNQGSDITYTDSATLGASFTINTAGVYAISYGDQFSVSTSMGLSLNTTTPTVAINANAPAEIIHWLNTYAAAYPSVVSSTLFLPAGSVVRAHTDGSSTGANPSAGQFIICRVA